mmetsp:Transcript_3820/g.5088  ORF Transcript_3820/g.5088 Transcript_3820/m.5088 type:complete len:777 (-) Transcript_3820:120-2450(-)
MSEKVEKINAVAFHPTLPHIAAVGESPTARVYDLVSGKYVAFMPLPGLGNNVCYSHDGRFLATATFDQDWNASDNPETPSPNQVCLWNAMDGYRLVKSDGYNVPQMEKKIMAKDRISKSAEIKEKMKHINDKFYKLHRKPIIALQFLNPWVEVPMSKKEQEDDSKHGGGSADYKHSANSFKKRNKFKTGQKKNIRRIEVLFSASGGSKSDDLLRFWEYNPRSLPGHEAITTIPSENKFDYGQGLRYLASLTHMDKVDVEDPDQPRISSQKRHQHYIAARVSDDGRVLCTLDLNSRTACLVKLAYEKMMQPRDAKLPERMNHKHYPPESERTISFPLILHKFEPDIQMLCLDFLPDPNPPLPEDTTGISNQLVGSYHVVFGGKNIRKKGGKSMIESITLEMANKSRLDNMLASEKPDDEELSPFILEASGVLSGSVRKLRINMAKKIQISNSQETITKRDHATRYHGIVKSIKVSPAGGAIATGDQYNADDGDETVTNVLSSWTQIPNGFSRKSIGNHTGEINCLAFPGKEISGVLNSHLNLRGDSGVLLTCGDATIHAWRHEARSLGPKPRSQNAEEKGRDMAGLEMMIDAAEEDSFEPLLTIEHQITDQQKKTQMKLAEELETLKKGLMDNDGPSREKSIVRQKESQEELMRNTLEEILKNPGSELQGEKALRLQEQMRAVTEEEDNELLLQLESGRHQEIGLESYARFTAELGEKAPVKSVFDYGAPSSSPSPKLDPDAQQPSSANERKPTPDSDLPQPQVQKRGQCATACSVQ